MVGYITKHALELNYIERNRITRHAHRESRSKEWLSRNNYIGHPTHEAAGEHHEYAKYTSRLKDICYLIFHCETNLIQQVNSTLVLWLWLVFVIIPNLTEAVPLIVHPPSKRRVVFVPERNVAVSVLLLVLFE